MEWDEQKNLSIPQLKIIISIYATHKHIQKQELHNTKEHTIQSVTLY